MKKERIQSNDIVRILVGRMYKKEGGMNRTFIHTRRTTEEKIAMVRLFSKYENAHEVQRRWMVHFHRI
jgi:hypothetical protein